MLPVSFYIETLKIIQGEIKKAMELTTAFTKHLF